MTVPRRRASLVEFFRRLLAGGAAALVLALAVSAAGPKVHDWLHGDADCSGGDSCPVMLLGHGVALPVTAPAVEPPSITRRAIPAPATEEILLVMPRYLRQPERGPPVS